MLPVNWGIGGDSLARGWGCLISHTFTWHLGPLLILSQAWEALCHVLKEGQPGPQQLHLLVISNQGPKEVRMLMMTVLPRPSAWSGRWSTR
jgi:hypothetical protein